MLTGNKAMIMRECNRRNAVRRVCSGSIDHKTFFHNIRGDLLISGYAAANLNMLADMISEFTRREGMPTIVLSSHTELFDILRQKQNAGEIARIMISDPRDRNYHPFYGMSAQQLLRFIRMTAEELGYSVLIDQVLQYASAALNIVSASYPVLLPALTKLLQHDDDFISAHALQKGLSNVLADNIRANHEAGIVLRRVCEKMESIFEEVYTAETDTKYSFQSGVQGNVAVMAFYSSASDQNILNSYLKEELFFALKRISKIRIVLDEMPFENNEDELLLYLFKMKRQGKIELILASTNARESVYGMQLNFANVILCEHEDPIATEELSKALWGTYMYNYPVPVAGRPAALLFTLKTTVHWQIATEERLKVCAEDLYAKQGFFMRSSDLLAVKTTANSNIYLIPSSAFLPAHSLLLEVQNII